MATNKHAIIRYQILDKCFSNFGRRFFMKDLINACNDALFEFTGDKKYSNPEIPGISRRQIFDDINFMESSEGWSVPLNRYYEEKKVYYRYARKDFTINNQPITDEEMNKLREMMYLLNKFKGLPQFEWMEELTTNLEDKFHLKGTTKSVISMESNQYTRGVEFISDIFNAIINKQVLHIEYSTFHKGDYSWDIHPYFIKQYNNRWFLIGLNNNNPSQITHLGLDRIKSLSQSSVSYIDNTLIDDFDEYFDDVVGVSIPNNKPIEHIKLQFSKNRYPYIVSKPFHGSIKFIDEENCIVTLDVIPNNELMALLLSFGSDVEVLEPSHLREEFSNIINDCYKKYFVVQNGCTP